METTLPDGVNLSNISKYCSNTRSLYIETSADIRITVYEGEEDDRVFRHIKVFECCGKYYLPVNSDENISQANGHEDKVHKIPGTTTWEAVRIIQGSDSVRIDINDFTFATSKGFNPSSVLGMVIQNE